jgi:receptor protein-tyrosine kinase
MSLIEKAAKRLAELQRAGAALPDHAPAGAPMEGAGRTLGDRVPIPEAAVRKRGLSDLRFTTSGDARDYVGGGHAQHRERGADIPQPGRRIELDFARLEQRGVIRPDNPDSAIAQEFRAIKRPILRNATDGSGRKVANGNLVMVTSALPGEGKTYVATNLAMSIAMEVDHTVMLVDGDVAHPSLPGMLDAPSSPGLLELLLGDDVRISDVLVQTNVKGLTLLPAGRRDQRATELLASEKMGRLLREITQRYPDRIVVFDSPPLLATSEAPVLATQMGQVIMAVAADSTTEQVVKQALALLEPCDVVMMLLNRAGQTDVESYYGYYQDEKPA